MSIKTKTIIEDDVVNSLQLGIQTKLFMMFSKWIDLVLIKLIKIHQLLVWNATENIPRACIPNKYKNICSYWEHVWLIGAYTTVFQKV